MAQHKIDDLATLWSFQPIRDEPRWTSTNESEEHWCQIDISSEELVHWCQGATGAVFLLARAWLVWKEETHMQVGWLSNIFKTWNIFKTINICWVWSLDQPPDMIKPIFCAVVRSVCHIWLVLTYSLQDTIVNSYVMKYFEIFLSKHIRNMYFSWVWTNLQILEILSSVQL